MREVKSQKVSEKYDARPKAKPMTVTTQQWQKIGDIIENKEEVKEHIAEFFEKFY